MVPRVLRLATVVLVGALLSSTGQAGVFDDVKNLVGKGVKAAKDVATAPTRTVINTAKAVAGRESISSIYKPLLDVGRATGDALEAANNLTTNPQSFIQAKALEAVKKAGGGPGEFVFDLGQFHGQYVKAFESAGVHGVAGVLRLQNPLQLVGTPLAAAIRAARDRHAGRARMLPDDVRAGLSAYFSGDVIARAKYTVGRAEITLPNFIGHGNKFMGDGYAVVVDDIIVFNQEPPSFKSGKYWWIHEMTHVEQYRELGVEAFAAKYLRDLGSTIEGEANSRADRSATQQERSAWTETPAAMSVRAPATLAPDRPRSPAGEDTLESKSEDPEFYVTLCMFKGDLFAVHYLLTNRGRLFVVDPLTGDRCHIGWASEPRDEESSWTWDTERLVYDVLPDGRIGFFYEGEYPGFGGFTETGRVFKLWADR